MVFKKSKDWNGTLDTKCDFLGGNGKGKTMKEVSKEVLKACIYKRR